MFGQLLNNYPFNWRGRDAENPTLLFQNHQTEYYYSLDWSIDRSTPGKNIVIHSHPLRSICRSQPWTSLFMRWESVRLRANTSSCPGSNIPHPRLARSGRLAAVAPLPLYLPHSAIASYLSIAWSRLPCLSYWHIVVLIILGVDWSSSNLDALASSRRSSSLLCVRRYWLANWHSGSILSSRVKFMIGLRSNFI